jgi:hypothetical protein
MKLKSIKVNSARADAGDWVGDLPGMDDLRLKVRGFSNADYQTIISKESAKVSREQREDGRMTGAVLPQVRDQILVKAMVGAILQDWKNLTDDEGKAIPYSPKMAEQLLSNPDFRLFRDAVNTAALRVEEDVDDQVKAVVPN